MFTLYVRRQLGESIKIGRGFRYLSIKSGIPRYSAFSALQNSNFQKNETNFRSDLFIRSHHSGNWERESGSFAIFGAIAAGAIGLFV